MLSAADVIRILNLEPHPLEGGYFRETYRSVGSVPASALWAHGADRSLGTAIFYLLTPGSVSEMHKLPGDEIFHFYLGDPVEMLQLFADGTSRTYVLGSDLEAGHFPQLLVSGGVWQGSRPLPGPHGFSLLGATMAPGFAYQDYVGGLRDELTALWPAVSDTIAILTPRG